ncbi:MAG TPA: hypothetical protein VL625_03890 [Patescibacteria group bacterium]|nr:hypothetical protein [Patescibacteria group bacterium]
MSLALALLPAAIFSNGDALRHAFNEVADRGVAPENRKIMTHRDPDGQYSTVIAGSYISDTGSIPIHAVISPGNIFPGNMDIDFGRNDAFMQAFHNMEHQVQAEIDSRPDLQALKDKATWTDADRRYWDSHVADIVSAIVHSTPGLDMYRTEAGDHPVPRTRHLNDISQDMKDGTHKKEFDCEGMSIVKIILMQRVADHNLKADQTSKYFYVSGMVEFGIYEDTPGGHAFIVTEKNGMVTGIVEGTEDSFTFRRPAENLSFADFVNGREIVTKEGSVYGFDFTHEKADKDRVNAGIRTYDMIMREIHERHQPAQQTLQIAPKPFIGF